MGRKVKQEEEEEEEEEIEKEVGQWVQGRDTWARAWVRNAVRTVLVLLTAQLSVAVPHFALLSGDGLDFVAPYHFFRTSVSKSEEEKSFVDILIFLCYQSLVGLIGGLTDTLQSLVLPPVIYLLEANRHRTRASADYEPLPSGARCWKLEFAACVGLALFGVAFMCVATCSNIQAIIDIRAG